MVTDKQPDSESTKTKESRVSREEAWCPGWTTTVNGRHCPSHFTELKILGVTFTFTTLFRRQSTSAKLSSHALKRI